MWRDVPALLCAGLLAALLELLWTFATGHQLFLGRSEHVAYASLVLTAIPVCVVAVGAVLREVVARPRAFKVFAACNALLAGGFAFLLTEGRRVRDSSLRPVLIVCCAVIGACVAWWIVRQVARAQRERRFRTWIIGALLLFAALLLAIDARLFVRSYPAFHAGLSVLAISSISLTGVALSTARTTRANVVAALLVLVILGLAPFMALRLRAQPNASYVVERSAPWSGKLLALTGRLEHRKDATRVAFVPQTHTQAAFVRGIDLRDRDVLLITVDALRADLLSAYGGHGLTPELDALAKESAVFLRAYTAAPHTSYALASLLTGKFLKPVFELQGSSNDPPTLPDLLRRYGYRTAAFYPPAIFFVDGSRFDALRTRGMGFEYRKEMFASADERVAQLRDYLSETQAGHPVFAWVHLFEPHEPYDPPPGMVQEDSARGRYEAEVAQCDRAIGELTRLFRAKRPGATLIISADHGEEFGDHGGHYHGTTVFDEQVRVPLLWSSPGSVKPGVIDAPVELVDVGTSVLSAAGVPREARMRGDDLGALLAGESKVGPPFAFAAVDDRHMVTDGHFKAVCVAREQHCQLFDLERDPHELRNIAGERPADLARLRAALDAFLTSIPQVEALGVDEGVAFPAALTRARLGAPGAGPDVIPLLADARPAVRVAAARILGELAVAPAATALERLRTHDADAHVRAEAAVAALLLGSVTAVPDVQALLTSEQSGEGLSLSRRAALALARVPDAAALTVLAELAHDENADELDRLRAVNALASVGSKAAASSLIDLLADVRLRPHVAEALGELGGRPAANALARMLSDERYQPARRAEARALQRLSDSRTIPLVTRFLGMETSIPDGLRILLERGWFATPRESGAALSTDSVRRGEWQCDEQGCTPGQDAAIELPAIGKRRGPRRVTFLARGEVGSTLTIDEVTHELKSSEEQFSFVRDARGAQRFVVQPAPSTRLVALSVLPLQPEIPAPPPEPWQADKPPEATP